MVKNLPANVGDTGGFLFLVRSIHTGTSQLDLAGWRVRNSDMSIWFCWVLVVACGIFSCHMWDLVPWPGMELRPPALNTQSLSHWTTSEVLEPKQSRNATQPTPVFLPGEPHGQRSLASYSS